jgi:hypothetical protein
MYGTVTLKSDALDRASIQIVLSRRSEPARLPGRRTGSLSTYAAFDGRRAGR